ncbi:hypothetical protein V8C37DRAFT_420748 [Trichoderma ceciliae]
MAPSEFGVGRGPRPPPPRKPPHLRVNDEESVNIPPLVQQSSQAQPSTPCCICNVYVKVWKCLQCDDSFCDKCWEQQRPHKPGKIGIDGRQHEKVDEDVFKLLQDIFDQVPIQEQQRRYQNDTDTTWFGVCNKGDEPHLGWSDRLVDILHESQGRDHVVRFPHLVSFVGQTGAGKSTIIKMLMSCNQTTDINATEYSTPVPGLVSDNAPTTGNVHLYADAKTYGTERPILYADSEGMSGGENPPRGLALWEGMESVKHPRTYMKNNLRVLKRLRWADTPKKKSREYAVTNFFPRILYTFSDVVVFVLREVRTFESAVLQLLIYWAANSIDKSINQPSRPHVVIVLNSIDPNINEKQWDPTFATDELLGSTASGKEKEVLDDLINKLKLKESRTGIRSTKELLEYYYSSVTVIRIPLKIRYMQIYTQVQRLHQIISKKCLESYHNKQANRMMLNAERLPQYVGAAYEHFSQQLHTPFDFLEEARRHMPLPKSFSEHILNLILSIDNTEGRYSDILLSAYYEPLKVAFYEFCNCWLRCSYQKESQMCHNTKNSHEKGHQAPTGKILSRGAYESLFDANEFFEQWIQDINCQIIALNIPTEDGPSDEKMFIPNVHRQVMQNFYKETGVRLKLRSHATCLYCVRKIPNNPLPCGHLLCKACIQFHGSNQGQGLYHLYNCPLHPMETHWPNPALVKFKPQDAGVRVLCLDGGGVRGIVELVFLQAVQKELGDHVPIQNFFDLIVGTSTGGIIALGLGVKHWSVSECIYHFKNLCRQAFTPRGPTFMKPLAIVGLKSYYRTKPLENALQSAFDQNEVLYGEPKPGSPMSIRVAVTATVASDNRPTILSNYNTEYERSRVLYGFVRPKDPAKELKVWQAARATAAAPPYFKPFVHEEALSAYIDGAINHNCPVLVADQERRLLWEDVSDWPADIVLSLGTGLSNIPETPQQTHSRDRSFPGLTNMLRIAGKMIDNQLDSEEIWKKYHTKVTSMNDTQRNVEKYRNIRINLQFPDKRPAIDDVNALDDIERKAQNEFQYSTDIKRAAHSLVASSFYFEKQDMKSLGQTEGYQCSGYIRCRFDEGSNDLKGLGRILQNSVRGEFVPFFLLQENHRLNDRKGRRVDIRRKIIKKMYKRGLFKFPERIDLNVAHHSSETNISLCLWPDNYQYGADRSLSQDPARLLPPISGFPRQFYHPQKLFSPGNEDDYDKDRYFDEDNAAEDEKPMNS